MSRLQIVDAARRYGEITALAGLSLTVEAGEIHAVVGLNGAGKTTAMRSVIGRTRLDHGDVRLFGAPAAAAGPDRWARLGHCVDRPFGYPELTVRANLEIAARLHGLPRRDAARAAARWLGRLELERWAGLPARGLSAGNRQRLGLGCVLAHEPDLVLLDEPTNALDPAGVLVLRDAVVQATRRGAGILVSSHHLDEVSRVADRISVVHAGRIVGSLEPGQPDLERRFFDVVRRWDLRHAERAGAAS